MMVTTESTPLDRVDCDLVLRIHGTSRDGQVIRLRSEKCTIGADRRCTLRLRGARGVQPLHCMVLRGPQAMVVRNWAADTRLNGRPFSDAELNPGDRLAIGPLEFEVLVDSPVPIDRPARGERSTERELAAARQAIDERRHDLERREAELTRQAREILGRQAELDGKAETLRQREDALARQAQQLDRDSEASLTSRQELDRRLAQFEIEKRDWESRRTLENQQEGALRQQAEELQCRRRELDAHQRRLDETQRRLEAERAECESARQSAAQEHQAFQAEIAERRQALEREQQAWDERRQTLEKDLDERTRRLEIRQAQSETPAGEPASSRPPDGEVVREATSPAPPAVESQADEDAPKAETEPVAFAKPSESAPLSSLDVLRRMGALPSFPEDEEQPPPPQPGTRTAPPAPQPAPAAAGAPSPAHQEEEEASVHQYMAQLLDRMRGLGGGTRSSPPVENPTEGPGKPQPDANPEPETPARATRPVDLSSPRAVAAERTVDYSALREVANLSAQHALDRHARKRWVKAVQTRLLVTLLGLVGSLLLLAQWWRGAAASWAVYAALVSAIVALSSWLGLLSRAAGRRASNRHPLPQPDDTPAEAGSPAERT